MGYNGSCVPAKDVPTQAAAGFPSWKLMLVLKQGQQEEQKIL